MEKETETVKIGITTLARVSMRGGALYLYLPRDLVEAYGLMAGDKVEVNLKKLHRSKRIEEKE